MICLVSSGLRSIGPSQKPARFVRIQPLATSTLAIEYGTAAKGLSLSPVSRVLGEDQDQEPNGIGTVSRWLLINIAVTNRGMIIMINSSSAPR